MPQYIHVLRSRNRAPLSALAALALLTAGCSSNSINQVTSATPPAAPQMSTATPPPAGAPPPTPTNAPAPSLKDKISNFFSNKSADTPQPVANAAQANTDCPFIDIRQGASTLTLPPPPPDGSNEAMTLRYQGTFVRAARECRVQNGQMIMNVGIQGRIVVGPAGGPGQVDVPMRIAVVTAPTVGSKLIVTKFIKLPVTVPDQNGTIFTHIEEGLTFPMPSAAELETYVVYIGFDPVTAANESPKKPAPAAKPKPKMKPNPNTPTG
ncbi:MAG TPA: hypothetical protein VH206_04625 [Xanthobacteraceae bacterium]|nr:hypothetical protein [Xanthobacteraceae bacterium]